MAKYSFVELIDIEKLQKTFELFSSATGLTIAILDTDEKILVASGWTDICTQFHRIEPRTEVRCRRSDSYIKTQLRTKKFVAYKCQNGLWDVAMPIMLQGEHVATLFSGQFFYDDDVVDSEYFRRQAKKFGFDEQKYLEALAKVPVFSHQRVQEYMEYLITVSEMLSEIELNNMRMQEEIRERRNAELALQKANSLLDSLINSIPDLIFYKDKDSVYMGCNDAFLEFAGTDREGLAGHTDHDFFTPDVAEFFRNHDRRMFREGKPRRNEEWVVYPDGHKVLLDTIKTPYYGPDGKLLGLIGVSRDITETKKLEDERARTAKLESIGVLAGGIAHDFNNLLMSIVGNITMAKLKLMGDQSTMEILQSAEEASLRARDLAKQLLTFSRGGAPVKELVDLRELIRETCSFSLRGANVSCRKSIPDDLYVIDADKGQISQVLNNLIINAKQAMPDGGRIDIKARNLLESDSDAINGRKRKFVRITIADHGCGMEKSVLEKVFDPYFTTKEKGSGLGLTTSYSIVKRHGGRIEVESTPGKGTVFNILLPAANRKPKAVSAESRVRKLKPARILIMDDDPAIRNVSRQMLQIQGHSVETARDGNQAIEMFTLAKKSGSPFDIVIVDLTIPGGMGGKQTAARLLELNPAVKIVVCSGYSEDPVMADFREHGFGGALAKPFSMTQLEEALSNLR